MCMAKLMVLPEDGDDAHSVQILHPGGDHPFVHGEIYVAFCATDGLQCFREEYYSLNDAIEYGAVHVEQVN